ncbi:MAG: hypothetical protein AB1473_05475 [Thermodesulfobacteriota bacterium]
MTELNSGLKIFVVILSAVAASLIVRPDDYLPNRPLLEDGFYSLAIARNIALGEGITADSQKPTNGFQLLFTTSG